MKKTQGRSVQIQMLIHLLKIEHDDHALSRLVFVIDSSSSTVNSCLTVMSSWLLKTFISSFLCFAEIFLMVTYTATRGQSVLFLVYT